jgi:hypothetical protein
MMECLFRLWCRTFHDEPMTPIHGRYICRRCLREYPVKWELDAKRIELHAEAGLSAQESAALVKGTPR